MPKAVDLEKLTPEQREQRQEILDELNRYEEELELGERVIMNGPGRVRELISEWKHLRPKMVKKYQEMGILEEFALVCLERRDDARMRNMDAGMAITDAREEANQNLFLWDEEDDLTEEEQEEKDREATAFALLLSGPMTPEKIRRWEELTGQEW